MEIAGIRDQRRDSAIPGDMLRQRRNGRRANVLDGVLPLGQIAQEIGASFAVQLVPGHGGAARVWIDDELADDMRRSRNHAPRIGAEILRRVGLDAPGRDAELLALGIDVEFRQP